MALAPFDHVEAPGPVRINGVLAFTKGDPIPVETAKRLDIDGKVIKANSEPGEALFTDAALGVVEVQDVQDQGEEGSGTDTGAKPRARR